MNMYFIALLCPDSINQQVLKWKKWMKEQFGCEAALRSPAHITLVPPCWMDPVDETNLIHSLDGFAATKDKFLVQLDGFSHFKPRVLFVKVTPDERMDALQNDLFDHLSKENTYPFEKDERPFHPHVTIATRDLHKKSFNEAWEHFKEKKYQSEWMAEGLSLLRHNKKNWDVITTSQFK